MLTMQKASFWKRISAFLLDGILLCILAIAFALLLNVIIGYDSNVEALNQTVDYYEQEYGVVLGVPDYNALSAEQKEICCGESDYEQNWKDANLSICNDETAVKLRDLVLSQQIAVTSIGILLSVVVLEFVLPLIFQNGQTLGKKVFGICVMRTNAVKLNNVCLFVRTFLGKYAIEIMVPVLFLFLIYQGLLNFVGVVVLGLMLLLQIILSIATKTNSVIHDVLADTVVVDYSSQMIFDSEQQLIDYKTKLAQEQVRREDY